MLKRPEKLEAYDLINTAGTECGWADHTMIVLMADFINDQNKQEEFYRWLSAKVATEQSFSDPYEDNYNPKGDITNNNRDEWG